MIHSIKVNKSLLSLFQVQTKEQFEHEVFPYLYQNNNPNFYQQLLALWDDVQDIQQEGLYQTAHGDELYLAENFTVFPDSKHNWDTVQIAYTNLTERKKFEEHLKYINQYDQLTQLYNRTFFNAELARLNTVKIFPISCIYIDVNGLKVINDRQGHCHGDLHLQHFACLLKKATEHIRCSVSRVGGDEFVILMPYATELEANRLVKILEDEVQQDTQSENKISFSSGVATMQEHQTMESLVRRADQQMYDVKKNYYRMRSV